MHPELAHPNERQRTRLLDQARQIFALAIALAAGDEFA